MFELRVPFGRQKAEEVCTGAAGGGLGGEPLERGCFPAAPLAGASISERYSKRIDKTDSQAAIMALTSAGILLHRAWILPLLKMQKLA